MNRFILSTSENPPPRRDTDLSSQNGALLDTTVYVKMQIVLGVYAVLRRST